VSTIRLPKHLTIGGERVPVMTILYDGELFMGRQYITMPAHRVSDPGTILNHKTKRFQYSDGATGLYKVGWKKA
jgi:hypothetical protein